MIVPQTPDQFGVVVGFVGRQGLRFLQDLRVWVFVDFIITELPWLLYIYFVAFNFTMNGKKYLLSLVLIFVLVAFVSVQVFAYSFTGAKWPDTWRLLIHYDSSLNARNDDGDTYQSIFSDAIYRWHAAFPDDISFVAVSSR
jgi:hypothetical protein